MNGPTEICRARIVHFQFVVKIWHFRNVLEYTVFLCFFCVFFFIAAITVCLLCKWYVCVAVQLTVVVSNSLDIKSWSCNGY